MKHIKTPSPIYLLLPLIAGIIFCACILQVQKQGTEIAMAKSNAIDYDNNSKEGQNFRTEFSYGLPAKHFEPFLLFMLGTIILSIVTGINLLRSRKVAFPLHSVNPADLINQTKVGAQKSPNHKNEAA
jgi:hypothetical protein